MEQKLLDSFFNMIENPKKFINLLFKDRHNPKKQELDLENCDLCDSSISLVFKNIDCSSIKILILSNNQFSNEIFKVLKQFKWDALLELYLDNNMITQQGIQMLAKAKLPQLKYFSFKNTNIKNEGVKMIIKKLAGPETTGLILQNTKSTFKGFKQFTTISVDRFEKMRYLNLSQNNVGNRGVQYLVKVNLTAISWISLNDCNIKNEGIKYLSKSYWPLLQSISLRENHFNYSIYQYLSSICFPELRNIGISCKGLRRSSDLRYLAREREQIKLFPSTILLYELSINSWHKVNPRFISQSNLHSRCTNSKLLQILAQVVLRKFELGSS